MALFHATALESTISQVFQLTFDFFLPKFAACFNPRCRDHLRKAPYLRMQQRGCIHTM